ncbi:MAG TPA: cupin domain-containing protein [Myxococcota bacterium]|nr:cupin domain-containing protein [Myxococcota bacterium]
MTGPNDLRHDEEDVLPDFEPMRPSEGLRARVLASIEPASRFEGFVARVARLFDLSEPRAREILAVAATVPGPGWIDTPLPGVRFHHFAGGPRVASADCGLVHLAPGTAFPRHRHRGREWNLVLSGSADESAGVCWLPGDLLVYETDSIHDFRAHADAPLLLAAILENGLEIV